MARVKYTAPIAEQSGTIGGVTYARCHYGKTARLWRAPCNKQRARQRAVRTALSYFSHYWSETLTQALRDAWDVYTLTCPFTDALGETYYLSGFNMFVRSSMALNAPNYTTALGPAGVPTANGFAGVHVPTFSFDASSGVVSMSAFVPVLDANDTVFFSVHQFQSCGQLYPRRSALTIGSFEQGDALPWTLYTYPAPPGGAADRFRQFIQIYHYDAHMRFSLPKWYSILNVA
jgi:hypothetical protein